MPSGAAPSLPWLHAQLSMPPLSTPPAARRLRGPGQQMRVRQCHRERWLVRGTSWRQALGSVRDRWLCQIWLPEIVQDTLHLAGLQRPGLQGGLSAGSMWPTTPHSVPPTPVLQEDLLEGQGADRPLRPHSDPRAIPDQPTPQPQPPCLFLLTPVRPGSPACCCSWSQPGRCPRAFACAVPSARNPVRPGRCVPGAFTSSWGPFCCYFQQPPI